VISSLVVPAAQRHPTEWSGLVQLLQRGIVSGSDVGDLFHRLETAFDARGALLGQHVTFGAWNVAANVSGEWMREHRKYEAEDPSAAYLATRPPGTFYLFDADLAQKTDFSRPNPVEHVYPAFRRSGLRDGAITRLYSPFVDDLYFVLYRPEGSPPFSEQERIELELLNPLLAGALAAKRALAALEVPVEETRAEALRRIRAYVYIAWPGPRVAWGEGARDVWRRAYGRIGARGWQRLERVVAAAATRFCTMSVGGRSQLLVGGIRAEFAFVPPERGEDRRMLVLFVEEEQGEAGQERAPAEELLSPRERLVARAAARGESITTIARASGIGVETARSCLKAVYAKLRVSSRVELAMLLGSGAARGR
jgi:DNA-binding CsgD family transcriptional regulator